MRAAGARRISAISAAIESLPAADQRRIAAAAGLLDRVAATVRAREYSGSLVPSAPASRHRQGLSAQ